MRSSTSSFQGARRALATMTCIALAAISVVALDSHAAFASDATITLDPTIEYQTMDGFGTQINGTNGTNPSLANMNATQKAQILDLLFDPTAGAGFSMLRLEAGSGLNYSTPGFTIEPTGPSTATGTPTYTWDSSADDLVYFAKQAKNRGTTGFYLNAWSAPAFMKVGGQINGTAGLCGEGYTCSSGDWRAAYADYLAQYVQDYAGEGIPIGWVDPVNEPEIEPAYQGMKMSASEAADFVKVLRGVLDAKSLNTKVACCDSGYYSTATSYVDTIMSDPTAAAALGVATSHGYGGAVSAIPSASAAGKPTWMTEFSNIISEGSGEAFNTTYTGGTVNGQDTSDRVMDALQHNVSAYFDFVGDIDESAGYALPNQALIANTSSSTYEVSKRLWAYGNYARFIRPGAVRIGAASTDPNLKAVAFTNTDGTNAVVLNNHNSTSVTTTIGGVTGGAHVEYVTDDASDLAASGSTSVGTSGSISVTVPANSTVTVKFTGTTITPPTGPGGGQIAIVSASMDASPFSGYGADKAIDGNTSTYAQSNSAVTWSLTADLGANHSVGSVVVTPDSMTYATDYTIETATAAAPTTWTTVATETSGVGTQKTYTFGATSARYVRMHVTGQHVGGAWGHALREFAVFAPSSSLTARPIVSGSMDASPFGGGYGADQTFDGNAATYAQSPTHNWSLSVDLGATATVSHVVLDPDSLNYAVGYTIDYATAAAPTTWITAATETAGDGTVKIYDFASVSARYLRVHVTSEHSTGAWGHAIDEISVAG